MGMFTVYIDLNFQLRLREGDEFFKAEILLFRDFIEEYGEATFSVPKYSVIESIDRDQNDQIIWTTVQLKALGAWMPIFIEYRRPDVLVLFDRRQE